MARAPMQAKNAMFRFWWLLWMAWLDSWTSVGSASSQIRAWNGRSWNREYRARAVYTVSEC